MLHLTLQETYVVDICWNHPGVAILTNIPQIMFLEEIKINKTLIYLAHSSMLGFFKRQIPFNSKIWGNKYCHYKEAPLYLRKEEVTSPVFVQAL